MAEAVRALSDPWYRAVAVEQWVQASLTSEGWLAVVDGVLAGGAECDQARSRAGFLTRTFKKANLPPLPSAAWALEVVPLLRVLAEDAKAGAPIELRADLRGARSPQKVVDSRRLPGYPGPGRSRVRHIDQTVYLDKWLSVSARLDDGTRVEVDVTDRLRHRKVAKKTTSGKHKTKEKEKWSRRVDVEVAGKAEEHELTVPTPPPRLPVYSKPGASRPTVTARLDHPLPAPGGDAVGLVLKVLGEAHRHVRPLSRGAA